MSHKILLVEDDQLSAEFMKISLEDEGYDVLVANSLAEATKTFFAHNPSIVITDIQLGDGSGIELAKMVKQHGAKKVIGVSGFGKSQLSQMGRDTTDFDQIFTKPVELSELTTTIRST